MGIRLGNQRQKPSRAIPYILSGLALIIALGILGTWLYIGYRMDNPPDKSDSDTSTSFVEEEPTIGRCLLILESGNNTHYLLVQTNPAKQTISILDIPSSLEVDGTTLSKSKNKTTAVSQTLGIPVEHYIQFDSTSIQQFISQTDGLIFTLPEPVSYQDENGNKIRLGTEERSLTGPQISAVLAYTNWKDSENADSIASKLVAAMLDQYIDQNHSLIAYFRILSDTAKTDLRIDNFNAYKTEMSLLANANSGSLCKCYLLDVKEENGRFIPDTKELKKNTDFYNK